MEHKDEVVIEFFKLFASNKIFKDLKKYSFSVLNKNSMLKNFLVRTADKGLII